MNEIWRGNVEFSGIALIDDQEVPESRIEVSGSNTVLALKVPVDESGNGTFRFRMDDELPWWLNRGASGYSLYVGGLTGERFEYIQHYQTEEGNFKITFDNGPEVKIDREGIWYGETKLVDPDFPPLTSNQLFGGQATLDGSGLATITDARITYSTAITITQQSNPTAQSMWLQQCGYLRNLVLTAGGYNWTTCTVSFTGTTGTGATATAAIEDGVIVSISNLVGGSGYTECSAEVQDMSGDGCTLEVVLTNGSVSAVNVLTGGHDYDAPTIVFDGNGSDASASADVLDGVITSLSLDTSGRQYPSNPTVTFTGDGTAAAATVEATTGFAILHGDPNAAMNWIATNAT